MPGQPEERGTLRRAFSGAARALLAMDGETRRMRGDFLRLLSRAGKASTLLDVGAADGEMTQEYARLLGVPASGIDAIEALEKYLEKFPAGLRVARLDVEKAAFPFPDASFEVVVCNQVLEHLKNIFLPLAEMERVLKPGGRLALGVPNLAALHNRLLLAAGRQPLCNHITGPHVRVFAHTHFYAFLRSNPAFEVEAWSGSSLYPLPYPLCDLGARIFPGLSTYTFYLLKKKFAAGRSAWSRETVGDTCL